MLPARKTVTLYLNNSVYQNDTLQFFGTGEGRARANAANTGWVYDYMLKDHLGNTRMVITDDYNVASPILEANSYYPFGLQQKGIGLTATLSNQQNKYLFNGNELQSGEFADGSGLDAMDFEARMYDPQIGRYWQQDPLTEYMRRWSPYTFSFDDPVSFNDPFGMMPGDTTQITPPMIDGSVQAGQQSTTEASGTLADVTVTTQAKPQQSTARKIVEWLPVVGFAADAYDAAKGGHWWKAALFTLAAIGDAATLGEEGAVAHAGESLVEHGVEELADKTAVQAEEEVAEKAEVEAEKMHGHHSDPKFMGGEEKQKLTDMPQSEHQQLHRDLNDHLVNYKDAKGNHMRPQPGNPGREIQLNFSREDRLKALRDFYQGPGSKYTQAAKDFFEQHPTLKQ
ncbi:hypothetical protein A9P82_08515 [Arachidicoccus ginsenosidimutans]|uniref:RHS repeat domain-containing protein n=1 Tax=Arachidicoccus sp. BS20 TaxID=1850526 RepID=UPI0007F07B38|nr:RHS repeat-associated core domain-containing protein [Arachidicoccus sp. BS20]ANI89331.1 hypothetical protein A9P82_08515 [Arachidicoccus sp. BS20]